MCQVETYHEYHFCRTFLFLLTIFWLAVASCVEAVAMVAIRSMPGDTLCTMVLSLRRYVFSFCFWRTSAVSQLCKAEFLPLSHVFHGWLLTYHSAYFEENHESEAVFSSQTNLSFPYVWFRVELKSYWLGQIFWPCLTWQSFKIL